MHPYAAKDFEILVKRAWITSHIEKKTYKNIRDQSFVSCQKHFSGVHSCYLHITFPSSEIIFESHIERERHDCATEWKTKINKHPTALFFFSLKKIALKAFIVTANINPFSVSELLICGKFDIHFELVHHVLQKTCSF